MRTRGVVGSPDGLDGTSDHLCWGYRSRDDRRAAVVAWLRDGLASGQHAWYVAEGTPGELLGDLAELPDRDAHLARGALRVDAAAAVYGTGAVSSDVQLRVYDDEVRAALAAGATGLRVAADVSCLVDDPRRRAGHLRWEHVSDRYAARRPFSAMCMYDMTTVADDAAEALVCLHPLRREREGAVRLTVFADGATVVLAGDVDGMAIPTLHDVLAAAIHDHDDAVDVSELRFVDGRAAAVIHGELSRRRDAGQRVRLVGANDLVRRVWGLCGFDQELLAG